MKNYLIILAILSCFRGISQTNSFLQVRIEGLYDYVQRHDFYQLLPETGCPAAGELYALLPYDGRKSAVNGVGRFYHLNRYGADSLFNYFLSPTAILNYLSSNGWQLVQVYPETVAGVTWETEGSGRRVPLSTVNSRLVYLWKR